LEPDRDLLEPERDLLEPDRDLLEPERDLLDLERDLLDFDLDLEDLFAFFESDSFLERDLDLLDLLEDLDLERREFERLRRDLDLDLECLLDLDLERDLLLQSTSLMALPFISYPSNLSIAFSMSLRVKNSNKPSFLRSL